MENNRPLLAPQGAHHSPGADQCVSKSLMNGVDDWLITQTKCKPAQVNIQLPHWVREYTRQIYIQWQSRPELPNVSPT